MRPTRYWVTRGVLLCSRAAHRVRSADDDATLIGSRRPVAPQKQRPPRRPRANFTTAGRRPVARFLRASTWPLLRIQKPIRHKRCAPPTNTADVMAYSLAVAAAATGLNKTAVLRAIKTGTLRGARNENGEWHVEPAELHRVYPPLRRPRPPRIRRTIATQMPIRPSTAELGIWTLREKWQERLEAPGPNNDPPRQGWRQLLDYLGLRRWASPRYLS